MRASLLLAIALTTPALAGCLAYGPPPQDKGIIVTAQPLLDAFILTNQTHHLAAYPSWAVTDAPIDAERIGTPFTLPPEAILEHQPSLVLDQPHPLVTGPSRQALQTALAPTNITYHELPTDPQLSTVRATLQAVQASTHTPTDAHWDEIQQGLATLNETLQHAEPKQAIVLFPASLVAGSNTDADLILELAGLENAAANAGLEGYRQITSEALQRNPPDVVIATSTMRETPTDIANKPMFQGTPIEDTPERVLVTDPSQTTRLGPNAHDAARMLATWAHDDELGPRIHATTTPTKAPACGTLHVNAHTDNDADITVTLLGQDHDTGTIPLPDVEPGHYRLHITATDADRTATITHLVTLEGTQCEPR